MSVYLPPIPVMFGAAFGALTTHEYTQSTVLSLIAGVICGSVALAAFIYSPIPHHNGGFGAPPAKKQKWGFTTEPAHEEYEEIDDRDVWGANLVGINYRTPKREDNE